MAKTDVEELFELVRVGDEIELHGSRTAEIAGIFGVGMQAPMESGRALAVKPAPAGASRRGGIVAGVFGQM